MVQAFGAILILLSGLLIGSYQSFHLRSRPQQIREWQNILQRLESEIEYSMSPLGEALQKISEQQQTIVKQLIKEVADRLQQRDGKTTHEIWSEVLEVRWLRTSLQENEKIILLQLGATLGQSNREDQVKHVQLARQLLDVEEEQAREALIRYGKMWKSLSILIAVLIIILIY